ncbi:ribonuclease H-like domain-containing protein [Tanacetum coccineum]|uniref:Ribonuclease H-like domain-containing protein n=1 Tax=Tanacetum coccineum TaxID=301880 RepID=A0ABQ5H0U7_9ASTR
MRDEYDALIKNSTWTLVPRPRDAIVVRCMWLFCHKYLADGTLSRYKAWLVANGSTQLEWCGCWMRYFSPVELRNGTIQTVLNLLQRIIRSLHQEFAMTDLGLLNYFLGISVIRDSSGMFLFQKKLCGEIFLSGADISYAVQQVCLHMHDPREPHFSALRRILRYVSGSLDYGLQLFSSSTTDLVAYSDADWASCPTTRRSTSGYCVFLGNNLLSSPFMRQPMLSRSSAEAEYRGIANHQRTKHIEIDIYFVRDLVAARQVRVLHVPSRYQFADIFTKGLPSSLFEEFRSSLSVRSPPAPTAGEC